MCAFVLPRLYTYVPPDETCVEALIRSGRSVEAVRAHPLYEVAWSCAHEALEAVAQTPLDGAPLRDRLQQLSGNVGSLVGTLFEFFLGRAIAEQGFESQRGKYDCDFVCRRRRVLDFELKTTSHASGVFGNRSQCQATRKRVGSFLLAINYDAASLTLRRVRLGWVVPRDWVAQTGVGQQSRLQTGALVDVTSRQCGARASPVDRSSAAAFLR